MELLLAALTFLLLTMVLLAAFLAIGAGRGQDTIRRRLESIEKAQRRGHGSLELQLIRNELLSDVPFFHRFLLRWSWASRLREFISQAGMKVKPGKLFLLSAVLGVGAGLLNHQLYRNPMLSVASGCVVALVPFAYVAFKRMRRLRAFEKNFPEALDLLGRAVRAGHAFTTGLELIGKELPEPVSGEFRTTFEEQNFGLPLKEALLNLAERLPLIDVRFFVTALLIQRETGGNLAEILENLARVIRERFKIYGEVRVRTAQGRLTAAILIALPPLMIAALGVMNPGYMRVLFEDPIGPYLLGGAATLQIIGSALLWKIVHIEV